MLPKALWGTAGSASLCPIALCTTRRGQRGNCPRGTEARRGTFEASLIVYTPHNVRNTLQQKADKWLTDAQLQKYEAILIHSHELELKTTSAQNLTQFLFRKPTGTPTHDCTEIVELQTKIRPDLEEELEEKEKWLVDGSATVVEGRRKSDYAVINGKTGEVVELGPLDASWSAQARELYAVYRTLQGLEGVLG